MVQDHRPHISEANPKPSIADRLLKEEDSATRLDLSPTTLATWRCTGRSDLPWVKIGRNVRYRESDILAFIARHMVGGETPDEEK